MGRDEDMSGDVDEEVGFRELLKSKLGAHARDDLQKKNDINIQVISIVIVIGQHTFLAAGVIWLGKTMIPFLMDLSSRILTNLDKKMSNTY